MKPQITTFLFLLVLLISVNSTAKTIQVSKNETVYKTIQSAVNIANPGDTVLVKSGIYNEFVTIMKSGTEGNFITILAEEVATIDGTGLSYAGTCGLIYIENKSFIKVEGFTIRNAVYNSTKAFQAGIWVRGFGTNIEIRNNKISNIVNSLKNSGCHGIAVYGTSGTASLKNIIIDNNEVFDCQTGWSEAIVLNGNVDGFVVANNLVHDNNNIGIDFIGHEGECPVAQYDQARNGVCTDNQVYNITSKGNLAYGNEQSADGIYVDGGLNIIIERNIIDKCDIGIELASEHLGKNTENIIVRNNFVSRSIQGNLQAGGYDSKRGNAVNCAFINNTTFQSADAELVLQYNCNGVSIKNNIFVAKPGQDYLSQWGSKNSNITVSNNIYWGKGENNTGAWTDALAKFVDPKLINPALSLHIAANSPAINNGVLVDAGVMDIDKQTRIIGDKIDIGADEFDTSAGVVFPTIEIESALRFYQNTNNQELVIELNKQTENLNLSLFNLAGQCVFSKNYHQVSRVIEKPAVIRDSGIYVYEILEDGAKHQGKIGIQKF